MPLIPLPIPIPIVVVGDSPLTRVANWQVALAKETQVSRATAMLLDYAVVDAVRTVSPDATRAVLARRIGGAMMVWRQIRPRVAPGGTRNVIDNWVRARALDIAATFTRLPWNNNLQATGAMAVYAAGAARNDAQLKATGIAMAKAVLDQIDDRGFTAEIVRADKLSHNASWAEYYSHETMIYLVATARMAQLDRNYTLWNYHGQGARTSTEPAMLRAGRLLDADLGNHQRYSAKTGKRQIAYPNSIQVGSLRAPSGYLMAWTKPFLDRYGQSAFPRLAAAQRFYSARPGRQFNAGVGAEMP